MSEEKDTRPGSESGLDLHEASLPAGRAETPASTEPGETLAGGLSAGPAPRGQSAFFPIPLTQEKSNHLLSVIRAASGEEGVGEPTPHGLEWKAGYGLVSVTMQNQGGGTHAQVTAGRAFRWIMTGTLGVVGGSIMAGLLEPITLPVFVGSVMGGIGIALGAGALYAKGAKKRVARLMDRIHRTMEGMEGWSEGPGEAGNIERLEALQDRREALGSRATLRRLTYAIALGGSLVSILPTALQFFPTEYPLPWMVVGFLGWGFTRTVRGLFRGLRERKELDREIEARIGATPP